MTQVTISVPATSANLGPGFDCLGLALDLRNEVTFTAVSEPTLQITAKGTDAHKVTTDESNLVYQCANIIFEKVGKRPSGLIIAQQNNIPVGSGLGSSSTAVLAGMLGANELLERPFTPEQILQFATEEEGHPDNVAPALYGGLVLGVGHGKQLHIEQIEIPDQTVVVVLPDFKLLTTEARNALPKTVPLHDAIFNASRTPLVVRALEKGDYDLLALAMDDKLHQPYRMPLVPGMETAVVAAKQAGAKAVAISGAGPSLIAFAPDNHHRIAEAIMKIFQEAGLKSRKWLLKVDRKGCEIN